MPVETRQHIATFSSQQLEAIAKTLGDTESGLTGSEIEYLLKHCKIPDAAPEMTKWKRVYNALVQFQSQHKVGNHVVKFINEAMNPARHTRDPAKFRSWREGLNTVLALCGMEVGDDGRTRRVAVSQSLDDALSRANRLRAALGQRNAHPNVLSFCRSEIVDQNYFHAVLEAMKSITSTLRQLADLTCDGAELVDAAFSQGKSGAPLLRINALATDSERGEQRGFVSLLKGLYGMIRNPLAHEPKIEWRMTEHDALDILTTISMIHRKLDRVQRAR